MEMVRFFTPTANFEGAFPKVMETALSLFPNKNVIPMPLVLSAGVTSSTADHETEKKFVIDDEHNFHVFTQDTPLYVQQETAIIIFGADALYPKSYFDGGGTEHKLPLSVYDHVVLQVWDGTKWVNVFTVYRGLKGIVAEAVMPPAIGTPDYGYVPNEFGPLLPIVILKQNTKFRWKLYLKDIDSDLLDYISDKGQDYEIVIYGLALTYDMNDYLPKTEAEVTPTGEAVGGYLYGY